ncbi:hypothetical protein [Lentzea cavernae]|uniref:Uncharacterized protein n=1 Tax=Lentzea cavernae TaxID=2020703 RepID=A0ABQ3MX16_9PSEU|nr:hypothetical protein [Lentzea cavernae]GHH57498.1 hypothetical protein GCM10017774_77080 [Lentzea cavernae]
MDYGNFGTYNPDLCACGCKTPVEDNGLTPRYATATCRERWAAVRMLRPEDHVEPELLDEHPQPPPPAAEPIAVEEVAQVQQEFAERVIAEPDAGPVRPAVPPGMPVPPRSTSLREAFRQGTRRVW